MASGYLLQNPTRKAIAYRIHNRNPYFFAYFVNFTEKIP